MKYEVLLRLRELSDSELAKIAIQMSEKHPHTFAELVLGNIRTTFVVAASNGLVVSMTEAQVNRFRTQYGRETKIQCIKDLRSEFGLGLKEAKDLCEQEFVKRDPADAYRW